MKKLCGCIPFLAIMCDDLFPFPFRVPVPVFHSLGATPSQQQEERRCESGDYFGSNFNGEMLLLKTNCVSQVRFFLPNTMQDMYYFEVNESRPT